MNIEILKRTQEFDILGITIAVKNSQGKFLLLKRAAEDDLGAGEWELPGGKAEKNYDIFENAKRELLEETGIMVKELEYKTYWTFSISQINKSVLNLAFVVNVEKDIKVKLSDEHSEYCWCNFEKVLKLAKHQDHINFVKSLV